MAHDASRFKHDSPAGPSNWTQPTVREGSSARHLTFGDANSGIGRRLWTETLVKNHPVDSRTGTQRHVAPDLVEQSETGEAAQDASNRVDDDHDDEQDRNQPDHDRH
jgi:hypothetical protein